MTLEKNNVTTGKKYLITVCKNGPYLTSGAIPLSQKIIKYDSKWDSCEWQDDKTFPKKDTYALCRCGQSLDKPFCDGNHIKTNFDGTETAHPTEYCKNTVTLDGPTLTLIDAKDLCASARFCHRAGGIWNLILTSDKPVDKNIAIEEASDCPSGRLVVCDKTTGKTMEPIFEPSIIIIEDPSIGVHGPIWVRGGIPLESANAVRYATQNRMTLCRCGKSQNKPFCDSSHFPEEKQ
jgi:CDGSH-type Zn-finger protein